jgi:5-methylcytosine-specific restriction endonuclease McrA
MRIDDLASQLCCSQYKAFVIRTLTRRQRNLCHLCGRPMDDPKKSHWRSPGYPTIDHWTPQSKGGDDEFDNLRMMHRACNRAKGDRLPADQLVRRAKAGDGLRGGLGRTAGGV